jgi:alkanesulfonate monooxygenase SsuD/methylene tetrahydromethanopterin reductase-like flavin-dependent oxidoreductase (luciferase family)
VPDYGRPLEFGYFIEPSAERAAEVVQLAQRLEGLSYDLVGIQDHPYQRRFLDTFALVGYVLARTERIRVFTDVANLPLRPPAMLAKTAASLDALSGGRFELGLGAGSFWDAIEAMGGPRRTPREATEALAEAIDVIRLVWSGGRGLRYDGQHYRLDGVHSGPVPAHDIGIWLGVLKPKGLALAGRAADGWVPSLRYVPPAAAAAGHARIDEAARAVGRDPAGIRRAYNLNGEITEAGPVSARDDATIVGPPRHWAETIAHFAGELGFDTFLFGGSDPAAIEAFIGEIAPRVRQLVGDRPS